MEYVIQVLATVFYILVIFALIYFPSKFLKTQKEIKDSLKRIEEYSKKDDN